MTEFCFEPKKAIPLEAQAAEHGPDSRARSRREAAHAPGPTPEQLGLAGAARRRSADFGGTLSGARLGIGPCFGPAGCRRARVQLGTSPHLVCVGIAQLPECFASQPITRGAFPPQSTSLNLHL